MISWLPPTYTASKLRSNALNNAFRIVLREGIDRPASVYAQERFEWFYRALCFALGLALAGAALWLGTHPVIASIPALLGLIAWRIPPIYQWIELRGHAVEVAADVAFYQADPILARLREARAMRAGYGGLFKSYSEADLVDRLEDLEPFATRWVNRHRNQILNIKERLG